MVFAQNLKVPKVQKGVGSLRAEIQFVDGWGFGDVMIA